MGCQEQVDVSEEPIEPNHTEPEIDYESEKPRQVSEEKVIGEIEKSPSDPAVSPVIGLSEAKTIVNNNLVNMMKTMQELQMNHSEWFGVKPKTDAYTEGVSTTKDALKPYIAKSFLDKWAVTYFEEFFLNNHMYEALHPSGMNTRFYLKEFTEDQFTLSYIQLGDEGYLETMRFDVSYVNEDDAWKFAGYNSETVTETLDLTADDLKHAFVHFETFKRLEGELVKTQIFEGEEYLILDYGDFKCAINSRTGEENSIVLEQSEF